MMDAWICDFLRTPTGRYGGRLSGIRTDELATIPIRALLARNTRLAGAFDEVFLGCANQAGEDNRNIARMAALLSGLPDSVPGVTVNRLCASGLEAVGQAARSIRCGEADLVLAGGVESMSRSPFVMAKASSSFDRNIKVEDSTIGWRFVNPEMERLYGTDPLPATAENLALERGISRFDQDAFAFRSQQRTKNAAEFHMADIVPVETVSGKGKAEIITADEPPRPDTTPEILAQLRPIVHPQGTITAGNASGVNDGAAVLLIASSAGVERHGLNPLARIVGMGSAGVPPRIMGIGPVPASQKLLSRLGWTWQSLDVIELNEAFAAQALACLREWGIPDDAGHVNPNGGAIALGHPLGMSGARIVGAAARQLSLTHGRRALVTLCVGVGQGLALALDRQGLD
ncbi:MAG: 3-oxoadipyl-CoA thiolase [Verrucomicrobia bacterium]|nr:3-oxoadipyl-CoA thiolase [Verrucomicrobiota bacterium]